MCDQCDLSQRERRILFFLGLIFTGLVVSGLLLAVEGAMQ